MYNKIYPPIFEKQKILDDTGRSAFQLIEQYSENDKGDSKAYKCTKKFHATLMEKNYFPLS